MNDQKNTTPYRNPATGTLPVALPALLLIVVVAGLLVMMVAACTTFTKKALHTTALKEYLRRLQARILAKTPIDPEVERQKMEILQKNIKTSCDQGAISRNTQLSALFATTCKWIKLADYGKEADKPAWLKFRALLVDFNDTYFRPATLERSIPGTT